MYYVDHDITSSIGYQIYWEIIQNGKINVILKREKPSLLVTCHSKTKPTYYLSKTNITSDMPLKKPPTFSNVLGKSHLIQLKYALSCDKMEIICIQWTVFYNSNMLQWIWYNGDNTHMHTVNCVWTYYITVACYSRGKNVYYGAGYT